MTIRMMFLCTLLTFRVLHGLAFSQEQPAVPLPDGVKAVWDIGKAHKQTTPTRESICINGLWQWQPASESEASAREIYPPTESWGWFKVPGSWPGITDYMQKDSQQVDAHPAWRNTRLGSVTRAWYQREIEIPEHWNNRRILLKADYVMSRAVVYVGARDEGRGTRVGEILFPAGEIDLTEFCEPGRKYMLSLEVTALPLADVIAVFGDTNAPRSGNASVNRRGLCGDVWLVSEPKGPRITDMKVETSVRKGEITVHVALEGIDPLKGYALYARIFDETNRDNGSSEVQKAFSSRDIRDGYFTMTSSVPLYKTWDIHTPENMYEVFASLIEIGRPTLFERLQGREGITSTILDETYPIRFGFREFWIDGRDLYLNGSRIWLSCVPLDNAQVGAALANYEAAKETMLRLKSFGVNFVYTHNYDCNPGSFISFAEILRAADDVGMLVSFAMPHFGHYDWDSPDAGTHNGYARLAQFLVREAQNHPSVIFYSMSHNATGYAEDMNPDLMDGVAAPRSRWAVNNIARAQRAEAIVQQLDPSRIVYHHASGNLGPMHISNFYVNWVPVQEMSDWFGHWATVGVKPMFTCEYGVPFTWDWAMYRGWYKGVREFGSAPAPWEFCNAEWNAQFLGDAAFQIGEPEKRNLRWEAKQFHALLNDEGKTWHRWDYPAQLGSREFTDQDLVIGRYITDNWRAFRTWGLSINSFWEHGRLWSLKPGVDKSRKNYDTDWENLQRPGFSPDFQDQRYERIDLAFERDDWIPSVAAEALIRNNSPLLGYIAGKDGAFTSKDHNFLPGETIEKQMVMVNNSREEVRAQCSYSSDDLPDWEDRALVSMYFPFETGEIKQLPMQYKLPNDLVPSTYTLRVNLRSHTEEKGFDMHGDTFTIHVMPPPEKIPAMNIALFDPKGETAKLLDELGVEYRLIHGIHDFSHGGTEAQSEENESTSLHVSVPLCEEFLVIGKDALDLSGDGFDLTGVPDGMKVIVFEQTAQTLEKRLGFRTAEYGLRQVFRRVADHPVLHNITDDNLRDWRGSSTLLPERLDYETNEQVFNGVPTVEWCGITVPRVWRCGNRGNVAGVLIEKPACGDFLPILDGGFSLQYSPLMEYRQGKGMILFCQMDVTGRTENDPAATHLVGNILRYVNDWKAEEKRKVAYTGKEEGVNYLKKIGASLAEFRDTGASIVAVPDDISPDEHVLALGSGSGFVISGELSSRFRKDGRVLMIGALPDSEYGMNVPFPEISTKEGEHISTYFEPFGMDSPLRGVGPADLHNRDPQDYPLVTGGTGVDVVGNGILAVLDDGRTVICGLAPWQFPADKQSFKRTFRRAAFTLSRLLGNMNVDMQTPLPNRFHGPVGQDEQRWLNGLYLDQPEEWDDPYRFFRW